MTYPVGDEVLDLRMQAAQDTDELARLRRGLQATEQALLDERSAGRNAFVAAAPGHVVARLWDAHVQLDPECEDHISDSLVAALDALLAAHRATTPSATPPTHVVVTVEEKALLDAVYAWFAAREAVIRRPIPADGDPIPDGYMDDETAMQAARAAMFTAYRVATAKGGTS